MPRSTIPAAGDTEIMTSKGLSREAYHGMTAFDVVADAKARGIE